MPNLPSVKGIQVVSVFEKFGFVHSRTNGSHYIMTKAGHRFNLSVPVHKGKDIKRGTLRKLIKNAGISEEDFIANL